MARFGEADPISNLLSPWGITPQIDRLVFYLFSLRRTEFPEAFWPKDRIRAQHFGEREFATDGATPARSPSSGSILRRVGAGSGSASGSCSRRRGWTRS